VKDKEFKFIVKMPWRAPECDTRTQVFAIYASYPTMVYSVLLKPNDRMAELDQERLAISELKVRLIQDIANAEFEREKE